MRVPDRKKGGEEDERPRGTAVKGNTTSQRSRGGGVDRSGERERAETRRWRWGGEGRHRRERQMEGLGRDWVTCR